MTDFNQIFKKYLLTENESPVSDIKFEDYYFDEIKKIGWKLVHPYRYSEDQVKKAEEILKNIGLLDSEGNILPDEKFDLNKKTKDGKTLKDLSNTFA